MGLSVCAQRSLFTVCYSLCVLPLLCCTEALCFYTWPSSLVCVLCSAGAAAATTLAGLQGSFYMQWCGNVYNRVQGWHVPPSSVRSYHTCATCMCRRKQQQPEDVSAHAAYMQRENNSFMMCLHACWVHWVHACVPTTTCLWRFASAPPSHMCVPCGIHTQSGP